MTWSQLINFMLLGIASVYSLACGGKPERFMGIAFPVAVLASAASVPWVPRLLGVWIGVLAADSVLMVFLIAVALRANRHWPLAMAAMKALTLIGHFVRLVRPDLNEVVYGALLAGWSFPMFMLLIVATWRHRRSVSASGPEPDWAVGPSIRRRNAG